MDDFAFQRAGIASHALRNADVQRLIGDRFYLDSPPENPTFPYVTGGRVEQDRDGTLLLTLHVWSRYGGRAETLDVIGALRNALVGQELTIGSATPGEINAQFADVFRSGDGRTTHGVLRLRVIQKANVKGATDAP